MKLDGSQNSIKKEAMFGKAAKKKENRDISLVVYNLLKTHRLLNFLFFFFFCLGVETNSA